jgi:excisionase family DNA binding protein
MPRNRAKQSVDEPLTIKVAQAARLAGCGQLAIRRGISEGTIPSIRFGRNVLLPRAAFVEWINRCGKNQTS